MLVVFLGLLPACVLAAEPDWKQPPTLLEPGDFPEPPALTATYQFGWASLMAAEADIKFEKPHSDVFELTAQGRTVSVVRTLWKLDATTESLANASNLRPIRFRQTEVYRSSTVRSELRFTDNAVTCLRTNSRDKSGQKKWIIPMRNVYDLQSAALLIRSQPLRIGTSCKVVVCPGATPYLASVTPLSREKIRIDAGTFDALKLDLKLWRIGDKGTLIPHNKFKRAYVWISNDAKRLILKARADIFVGSVWAELHRVNFSRARSMQTQSHERQQGPGESSESDHERAGGTRDARSSSG